MHSKRVIRPELLNAHAHDAKYVLLFATFVNPPPKIHFRYEAWQDGFRDMEDTGIQFHEGVPTTFHLQKWFPKGGLLVLDDPDGRGR